MKKDRAKRALPTWVNEPPTEKVHFVTTRPKVIVGGNKPSGVKRPQEWTPKDVLKNYGK